MHATVKTDRTKITVSEVTKELDGDQAALPADKPKPFILQTQTCLM